MFTYSGTDVDRLNAVADLLLLFVGYSVGHNDLFESAAVERLDGVSAQDAMGDNGNSVLSSALIDQDAGGLDKSSAGVRHIVHENSSLASYFSDQGHSGDFVRTSALLVD